jgi:opacity protein-like surface antigen
MTLRARRFSAFLAATSTTALLSSSMYANAADLVAVDVEPPVAVAADTWTGIYGGVHAGIGAFTGTALDWNSYIFYDDDATGDFDLNDFAGVAGVQGGYNWQSGNAVYGFEADWAWTGFDESRSIYVDDYYVKADMEWLATLRGRLGVTAGNGLAYVTGGLALAHVSHCADYDNPCTTDDDDDIAWSGTLPGLAVGAGVEARLNENWSFKSEYLFVQLANENIVYNSGEGYNIDFSDRAHIFRIGLNYHPGGLPLAEVAADGPWSGFYAGVHGGIGAFTGMAIDWDRAALEDPDGDIDQDALAGVAGVQAGYDWQDGNVVYGLAADWAWTGFDQSRTFGSGEAKQYIQSEIDWLATFRGRLGLAAGNGLAYVTGGLALAKVNDCADDLEDGGSICGDSDQDAVFDGTLPGLAVGAGVEARLNENWSLNAEYVFVQLDKENVEYDEAEGGDLDFSGRAHLFRVGLNYHLNGIPVASAPDGGPWSGFYAGLQGGIGAFTGTVLDWDDALFEDPTGDFDQSAFAGLAGVQAGHNWQNGNVVYGLEADWAWTGFDEAKWFGNDDASHVQYVEAQMDWLATFRGRLGMTAGNALFYATGGLALAQVSHCADDISDGSACGNSVGQDATFDGTLPGLVAGAGVEVALRNGWSLKSEYLFVQLDNENVEYDTAEGEDLDFSDRAHLFRVGLNYKF